MVKTALFTNPKANTHTEATSFKQLVSHDFKLKVHATSAFFPDMKTKMRKLSFKQDIVVA
jgi:hypothetical protein